MKKGGEPASLAAYVLVTAVAVLFVLSFTHYAVAAEGMAILKGEVIAVDSYGRTLTVRPIEAVESFSMWTGGGYTFTFDQMTNVIRCYQNKALEDIEVGERVTVTYHEEGGSLFADAIDIAPLFLACYDQ